MRVVQRSQQVSYEIKPSEHTETGLTFTYQNFHGMMSFGLRYVRRLGKRALLVPALLYLVHRDEKK